MSGQLSLWPGEGPGERLHWSVSRHRTLSSCARRYYYQYYGSRGGAQPDAPAPVRDLYVLKQLRNRFMWVGEVVHEMIELALANRRRDVEVPVSALIERGTRRMRAQYAESLQRLYRDRPGRACGLVEHEYDEPVEAAVWQERRDAMHRCLETFDALPFVRQLLAVPTWRWLAIETFGSFELDGARIVAKPDFVVRGADDAVDIVDWKTGQAETSELDTLQLAVYGLYARRVWDAGDIPARSHLVYLARGEVASRPLDEATLESASLQVSDSIARMRSLAPHGAADVQEDAFERTSDRDRCRHCPFRRPCGRE